MFDRIYCYRAFFYCGSSALLVNIGRKGIYLNRLRQVGANKNNAVVRRCRSKNNLSLFAAE